MEPRGFVMKGADRKMRLDQRQVRIAAVTGKPDDGQEEEMEQERLEREADEIDQPTEEGGESGSSGT